MIVGKMMAKKLKLCEVHSFSTSSNSRHHTTVVIIKLGGYVLIKTILHSIFETRCICLLVPGSDYVITRGT